MSKLSIFSYRPHNISLPWPHYTAENPAPAGRIASGDFVFIRPGEGKIQDKVLTAYASHPQIRPLLLAGNLGGIVVLAEDGKALDHFEALRAFYPDTSEADLRTAVAKEQKRLMDEQRAEEERRARAQSKDYDTMSDDLGEVPDTNDDVVV